jgi:flagellum-specific ATP synthase
VRAYTPHVIATLPRVVERCGAIKSGGSITAVITVLSETDDVDDPIVEIMKSLLDGHIVLSRTLAERSHFPAIDIARSVSRGAERLVGKDQTRARRDAVALVGAYEDSRVMIESGVYKRGTNRSVDRAIAARDELNAFLRQAPIESCPIAETVRSLRTITEKFAHV